MHLLVLKQGICRSSIAPGGVEYELVINLKTAKTLGLDVPPMPQRAEVIE
jgi:hypothetical protein